jgi:hypothetical protein
MKIFVLSTIILFYYKVSAQDLINPYLEYHGQSSSNLIINLPNDIYELEESHVTYSGEYEILLVQSNLWGNQHCGGTSKLNNARLSNYPSSDYIPLLSNSVWLSSYYSFEGYANRLDVKLNDTLINGFIYTKVLAQYINLPGVWNNPFVYGSYLLYLREDTISRTVYDYNGGFEIKILDFSLQIGDALFSPNYILNTIDSIFTFQGYRKRFIFTDTSSTNKIVWVEGLGNLSRYAGYAHIFL